MNLKDIIVILVLVTAGTALGGYALRYAPQTGDQSFGYGLIEEACDTATSTMRVLGPATSNGVGVVLEAYSNRSYAKIEATSTVYLSLDEGAGAEIGRGVGLNLASTSPSYIEFGRSTSLPYTGAVTGIWSGSGSTTVMVTECRY